MMSIVITFTRIELCSLYDMVHLWPKTVYVYDLGPMNQFLFRTTEAKKRSGVVAVAAQNNLQLTCSLVPWDL